MPTTIASLSGCIGLAFGAPLSWKAAGKKLGSIPNDPGVYVIIGKKSKTAPIDPSMIMSWIARCPKMKLNGTKPTAKGQTAYLSSYWLPNETVLYIGKAGSNLRTRIGQFLKHNLGAKSPHSGGQWLLALSTLPSLQIYWSIAESKSHAAELESRALLFFASQADTVGSLPFANLTAPKIQGGKGRSLKESRC